MAGDIKLIDSDRLRSQDFLGHFYFVCFVLFSLSSPNFGLPPDGCRLPQTIGQGHSLTRILRVFGNFRAVSKDHSCYVAEICK